MTTSTTSTTSTTCLLVIDAQQSFTRRSYFDEDGMSHYLQRQNALIALAQARGWRIVRVFHHEPGQGADDPFSLASGLVRPLEGVSGFDADLTTN